MVIRRTFMIAVDMTCYICTCVDQTKLHNVSLPVAVLMKPDGSFVCFDAKQEYVRFNVKRNTDWSFFHPFEAKTHCEKKDCLTIRGDMGKEVPAKTVFSHAIRYLKEQSLQQIRHSGVEQNRHSGVEDCAWEFTVPADWGDMAVQTFKDAVSQTGIPVHLLSVERKEINIPAAYAWTHQDTNCEEVANDILLSLSPLVNLELPNFEALFNGDVNCEPQFPANTGDQNQSFHMVYQLVEDLRMQKASISECGLRKFLKDMLEQLERLEETPKKRQTEIQLQQILDRMRKTRYEKGHSDLACDMRSVRQYRKSVEDATYSPTYGNCHIGIICNVSESCTDAFNEYDSFRRIDLANEQNSGVEHNAVAACRFGESPKMARLDGKENTSHSASASSSVEFEEPEETYFDDTEVQYDATERSMYDIESDTDIECDADTFYVDNSHCDSETYDTEDDHSDIMCQIPKMIDLYREDDTFKEIPQPNYPKSLTQKVKIPLGYLDSVERELPPSHQLKTCDELKLPMPHGALGSRIGYEQCIGQEDIRCNESIVVEMQEEQSEIEPDICFITADSVDKCNSDTKEEEVTEATFKREMQTALSFVESKKSVLYKPSSIIEAIEGLDELKEAKEKIDLYKDKINDWNQKINDWNQKINDWNQKINDWNQKDGSDLLKEMIEKTSVRLDSYIMLIWKDDMNFLQERAVYIFREQGLKLSAEIEDAIVYLDGQETGIIESWMGFLMKKVRQMYMDFCLMQMNDVEIPEDIQEIYHAVEEGWTKLKKQACKKTSICLFPWAKQDWIVGTEEKSEDFGPESETRLIDQDNLPGWNLTTVVKNGYFQDYPKRKRVFVNRFDVPEKSARGFWNFPFFPRLALKEAPPRPRFNLIDGMDANDLSRLLFQMTAALKFLHKDISEIGKTIVHFDLTPENIVIDSNLNARLIDFGLAREMKETNTSLHVPEPELHESSRLSIVNRNWLLPSLFDYLYLDFSPKPMAKRTSKNGFKVLLGELAVGADVLKKAFPKIVKELVGEAFLMQLMETDTFFVPFRLFLYQWETPLALNKYILQEVMFRGEETYEKFKEFLEKTGQSTLSQYLTHLEDRLYCKRYDNYLKRTTNDPSETKRKVQTVVQNRWIRFEGEPQTEVKQTLKGRQLTLLTTGVFQDYEDSGENPGLRDLQREQLKQEEAKSCSLTSAIFVLISVLISGFASPCSLTPKPHVNRKSFRTIIFLALLCFTQAGYSSENVKKHRNSGYFLEPFDGALVHISKAWDLVEEIKGGRNELSELDIFNDLIDYDKVLYSEFRNGWLPFKIKGEMHRNILDSVKEDFEVQCGSEKILLENFTKLGLDNAQNATEWTEIRVCITDPLQNTTGFLGTDYKAPSPKKVRLQTMTQKMDVPVMERCKDETICYFDSVHNKKSFTGVFEITDVYETVFAELIPFVVVVVIVTLFFCCIMYEQSYMASLHFGGAVVLLSCLLVGILIWGKWRMKKDKPDTNDLKLFSDYFDELEHTLLLFWGLFGQTVFRSVDVKNECFTNIAQNCSVTVHITGLEFIEDKSSISDRNICYESTWVSDDHHNVQNEGYMRSSDLQEGRNISCHLKEHSVKNESYNDDMYESGSDEYICEDVESMLTIERVSGVRVQCVQLLALLFSICAAGIYVFATMSKRNCQSGLHSHVSIAQETCDNVHYKLEDGQADGSVGPCCACAAEQISCTESPKDECDNYICLQEKGKHITLEDIEKERHFQQLEHLTAEVYSSEDKRPRDEEPPKATAIDDVEIHDSIRSKAYIPSKDEEIIFEDAVPDEADEEFVSFIEEESLMKKYESDSANTDDLTGQNYQESHSVEDEINVSDAGFVRSKEQTETTDVEIDDIFKEKYDNISDQDNDTKQRIQDNTNTVYSTVEKQVKSSVHQGPQGRNSSCLSASKKCESYRAEALLSSSFNSTDIEENGNEVNDLIVSIPPSSEIGASLPLTDVFPTRRYETEKFKLRMQVEATIWKNGQQSDLESVVKKAVTGPLKRDSSMNMFQNLKHKMKGKRSRKGNKDCTFTEGEFETLLAVRACTWLPLNELPVPKIDITVAYVPQFEPLLSIIDQIANGTPPTPHVSMRYELLRFCTLRSYPKENKPYLIKLAEAGFYYASDGDGVVCYCCGVRRYNWVAEDDPMKIHKRINPNCKFLRKNEEVNVPVQYFGPFSEALIAIMDIPEPRERTEQSEDVNNDWAPERIRSPAPTQQNRQIETGANSLGINTALPKHTQYATKTAREASYSGWPDTASHNPQELADAGFFYAGFGDCVRCFYCGIGLRHWTKDDNPWIEHARWSRNCVFVKQKKGEEFVNLVQLAVQYSQDNEAQSNSTAGNQLPAQEIERILLSDAAQSVLEMGYQPRIIKKAIEQILRQDGNAKITAQILMEKVLEIEEAENPPQAAPAPAPEPAAAAAAPAQAKSASQTAKTEGAKAVEGAVKSNTEKKPDEGTKASIENKDKDKNDLKTNSVSKELSEEAISQDPKAIKAENEQLKEQTLCKVCLDNTVCIVFLPCGHLVTCADCAPAMRKCPICRALVKGTVRTYMS